MGAVTDMVKLADGVYSMWVEAREIAEAAEAGQFVAVYSKDGSRLLPRPISLCEIDKEKGALRLVFRVVGAGTEEFSRLAKGDQVEVMGLLETVSGKRERKRS